MDDADKHEATVQLVDYEYLSPPTSEDHQITESIAGGTELQQGAAKGHHASAPKNRRCLGFLDCEINDRYDAETSQTSSLPGESSWRTHKDEDDVIRIPPIPQYATNSEEFYRHQIKHMKPQVYRAITMGKNTDLKLLFEDHDPKGKLMISGRGNTILHVTASLGHSSLVEQILSSCPSELIFRKNLTGNLPLHLAAAAGHQTIVETLLRHAKQLPFPWEDRDLLIEENEEKNTALHLAMKNHHYKLAIFLAEMNPETTIQLNHQGVSPLYMATEEGNVELVNLMLKSRPSDMAVFKGKSLVHAAIKGRNTDVLDAVMRYQSSNLDIIVCGRPSYCILFEEEEKSSALRAVLLLEEGRTPLSFASSNIDYLEAVRYFLDKTFDATYTRDEDGSYPIHVASRSGHVKIIEEFMRRCPDSWELLDKNGKNILHVAAESGKSNVVRYILEKSELTLLINERDGKGNSPLHLATKNGHARIVSIMTWESWDKRVKLELVNDEGLTALDVAENHSESTPSYQKGLTWLALRYAGAPRAKQLSTSKVSKRSAEDMDMEKAQRRKHQEPPNMESYKDRVNTLLVVATLVATMTFAAGFTMPGGYNSSDDPHQAGMVTLVKKSMFHVFLISNTIAMYSSIIVAILLFWALMNDLRLGLACLKLAVPLLGISLLMVSLAFMAAIYLVVSNEPWLSTVVLIIASLSLIALLLLILPLSFPYSLNHRISRYIIRYPFYLLILVIERISTKE